MNTNLKNNTFFINDEGMVLDKSEKDDVDSSFNIKTLAVSLAVVVSPIFSDSIQCNDIHLSQSNSNKSISITENTKIGGVSMNFVNKDAYDEYKEHLDTKFKNVEDQLTKIDKKLSRIEDNMLKKEELLKEVTSQTWKKIVHISGGLFAIWKIVDLFIGFIK